MFWNRKKETKLPDVDPNGKKPVIRASICTGEKVAGFKDPETGVFEDVMLIRDETDLEMFCRRYQVRKEDIRTIY